MVGIREVTTTTFRQVDFGIGKSSHGKVIYGPRAVGAGTKQRSPAFNPLASN